MIKLSLLGTLHESVSSFTHMTSLWQNLDLEILADPKEIALSRASGASLGPQSSPGHVPKQPAVAVVLALVGAGSDWRTHPGASSLNFSMTLCSVQWRTGKGSDLGINMF